MPVGRLATRSRCSPRRSQVRIWGGDRNPTPRLVHSNELCFPGGSAFRKLTFD